MLYKVNEESIQPKDIIHKGIEFKNVLNLTKSTLFECKCIIDGYIDDRIKEIKFDNDRLMYDLKMGFFLVIYEDKSLRDKDLEEFKEIKIKSTVEYQNPFLRGNFDYKGKYCIIYSARLHLDGDTNEYLYKGMIVNPLKRPNLELEKISKKIKNVLEFDNYNLILPIIKKHLGNFFFVNDITSELLEEIEYMENSLLRLLKNKTDKKSLKVYEFGEWQIRSGIIRDLDNKNMNISAHDRSNFIGRITDFTNDLRIVFLKKHKINIDEDGNLI